MRAVDIIIKKRDKKVLSKEEIEFFIEGYTSGDIPDYQAAALAMAILLNGICKLFANASLISMSSMRITPLLTS